MFLQRLHKPGIVSVLFGLRVNDKHLILLEFLIIWHALSSMLPILATDSLHYLAFVVSHSLLPAHNCTESMPLSQLSWEVGALLSSVG